MKIWAKMYKIWKYFEKGQTTVCDYRTQKSARKGPGLVKILEFYHSVQALSRLGQLSDNYMKFDRMQFLIYFD